ncbi:glycosyltransferase family 2 protein [Chitinophaga sp. XS-30]|uniref:glycosyltransferase family 2 protein n=1 Tax=Chitinophaga sp. XS-30 TaxID=2604421 RepID=UPI0011DDB641|nr:glycosyltransferase family 2 protein [Chitinophaga sp. XS-30]QEH42591.1 glycosyltransferase family 2 protein [Chitinophaga sp. XS-30]
MESWFFFIFWISLFILFYSYIGYGILLYIVIRVKRLFFPSGSENQEEVSFRPKVTFMVAAYNEASFIREKIANTLALDYPADLLEIIFVTDGSTDGTDAIIADYPQIRVLHEPARKGKTVAINRAMSFATAPYVIFSDANTLLNKDAVSRLISWFRDPATGAVAGEKKVIAAADDAEGMGEGAYWKYESLLKKWDAELYSVMGAAGELFAIRTELYEPIPADTILDDFVISFGVNMRGYKVKYAPDAYAMETPSASLGEEYKRKVRISAGGFQSMGMLLPLFNVFRYPRITWQYVSHRVLRWTLAPLCLPLALLSNIALVWLQAGNLYTLVLGLQLAFYIASAAGYILARKGIKVPYCYIPFYFLFMNIAVYHGFSRFLKKRQSAVWERSERRINFS